MDAKKMNQWRNKNNVTVHGGKEAFLVIITLVWCIGIVFTTLEVNAQTSSQQKEDVSSDMVTYEFADGVLTFSGQGIIGEEFTLDEYGAKKYPWYQFRDKVTHVVLEEGIIGISSHSFDKFSMVESVSLPESLQFIGDNAFSNCSKLTSIKIPDNVTSIGAVAFEYDTALTEVYIGGNKNALGYSTGCCIFRGCTALQYIHVSEDNIGLCEKDGVLFTKEGNILIQYPNGRTDNLYKIPEGTKEIGSMAFARTLNLENIEISEGVTKITEYAMYDCPKLKEIVLPTSVTTIERGMGDCCFYLKFIDNKSQAVCPLDSTSGGIVWTDKEGKIISEIGTGVAYQHRVVENIEMKSEISVCVGEKITLPMSFSAPDYLNSQGILANYSDLVILSSNPEIIQVAEDGTITAMAVGSAVVEVKNRYSQEWFKAVSACCKVTVNNKENSEITPTKEPTAKPTQVPIITPTAKPTEEPTAKPTQVPTITPTAKPTVKPTDAPEVYKITYILNKGTNHNSNPSVYTTKNIKLLSPTRAGYSFKGWYMDKKMKRKITTIKAEWKKNITVYAKWVKVKVGKPEIKSIKNYKGKQIKVQLKNKVNGAKGYEVTYSTDKKFKKSVMKISFKGNSKTIEKLKKNKTYYVKVRAYKLDSTGEKVYGSYSNVKKIKITK